VPRDWEQEPKVCPKCKNPYWNRPRRNAKGKPGKAKPADGGQK
jgi:hypothetical protein